MAKTSKSTFDLEAFLAKADGGVTISKYRKGQVVFTQGDPADTVFYIREGRVKILSSLRKVRKQWSLSSRPKILSARVV
jgi:CRP-like cAMP-binding protein